MVVGGVGVGVVGVGVGVGGGGVVVQVVLLQVCWKVISFDMKSHLFECAFGFCWCFLNESQVCPLFSVLFLFEICRQS